MPQENTPPGAPATRTMADIEAELQTIDVAAKEIDLAAVGTPPAAAEHHDYEAEARRKGWRPESEYSGASGKWVDAKTFIERGERFTKKLEDKITALEQQIAGFEGTKAQFRKFFDEQMAKRDREYTDAIAALRIQKSQATREGDDELAVELEDRIETTRKAQAEAKTAAEGAAAERTPPAAEGTPPAVIGPVMQDWIDEGNQWFTEDKVLGQHAFEVATQLRKDGDKTMGRAFLEKVGEQVRADFPRRFKATASSAPRPNASGGMAQNSAGSGNQAGHNGKTERDLPPEDLALMRSFIKDGLYTKETFLKSYFSRNGA